METEPIDLIRPGIRLELARTPSIKATFARVLLLSLTRSQGRLGSPPRETRLIQRGIRQDPGRIRRFREVCRCAAPPSLVPVVYPETLFIGMLGKLIVSPGFPVSPLGLIHVGQTIVQVRPIDSGEVLDAECALSRVTRSTKGIRLDCTMEVTSGRERVWYGKASFLSRSAFRSGSGGKKTLTREELLPVIDIMDVPRGVGLAYAAASGDYNPHHLHGFTARLIGFKSPIAHGMWTLARAAGSLERRYGAVYPLRLGAAFKLPIHIPSRVTLGVAREEEGLRFEVRDVQSRLPHLAGLLVPGCQLAAA